ncbi:MAG: type II toxin-antitoxin system YafQ family toxin [Candidatus Rifleibacteriota bacterium]
MLNLRITNRFKKDLKRMTDQGKSYEKLRAMVEILLNRQPLDSKYSDHPLVGNWKGRRELHVEADWLLIYKIEDDVLILERTGTHSHLFK